ncbi:FAT-domain-containing protein [Daedalea quercina L-15889]|uniref:FAT-domain-containing protein n=1 Tax=Daedalea quercina L-15889 TaxID=1314783 RepID=A0A165U4G3_9APHY|nr:FAT-domain-containing protein [Daedalea quercina L-15889]
MDGTPTLTTAADLEMRAARVADPGTDLKTKLNVAYELREMIDVVREAEAARVIPHMVPILLDILRTGEVAYNKDALEFQFRRCLLDIIHRLPANEGVKPQAGSLFSTMIHLLRHDNEENGSVCCKIIGDIVRSYRILTDEMLKEYLDLYAEVLRNIESLVEETLSADSAVVDANIALPAQRSFKVLGEYAMATVSLTQTYRQMVLPALQAFLPLNVSVLMVQAPVQREAKENYEAMGGHWAGMAPGFKNPSVYADFTSAQVKLLSCLAFMYRGGAEQFGAEGDTLAVTCIRLLQDCPPTAIAARRDLMVVFRHLLNTPYRRAIIPEIDKIFDDRVLWGTGVGCREAIRQSAFACAGDLAHHLRPDMTPAQLTNVCLLFLRHLLDPRLPDALHHLCAKVIFGFLDPIATKDTQQSAAGTLRTVLDTLVDKVSAMADTQTYLANKIASMSKAEKAKEDESSFDYTTIEKARPVGGAMYAVEKPGDALIGHRQLTRTLMPGFRVTLSALKKCDAPVADGTVISRLFDSSIRCIAAFDGEPREAHEALEWLGNSLIEVNLHVFQEVWTRKIEFFFTYTEKHPVLMHLAQVLFSRESSSPTLVAIMLRFLVNHLPELGDQDDKAAAVVIRLFKLTFGAVGLFPPANEPILASHLGKLIMDCFPLAAKAAKPTNYFLLLRLLFRAIGGGGGRFEMLYKEVLPLLPEMLESLNRQLLVSEGPTRDLVAELCLTVPLRLTHLLPYLSYLMRPLVLALRGTPEMVSQGIRTLELCIDNLTPDFLDPTLNAVLRDLMEALHKQLKPLPANHQHSHTTIRILGKLGGRNRRLLDKEPSLSYRNHIDLTKARVSFGGTVQAIELSPVVSLASSTLASGKVVASYRLHAYNFLETCLALLLHEGLSSRDREQVFVSCLESLHDALHMEGLRERANKALQGVSRYIVFTEVRRHSSRDPTLRRYPSRQLTCFLDAMPHGLARDNPTEAQKAQELLSALLLELVEMVNLPDVTTQDIAPTLSQIAARFSALCLEDSWVRRAAGCTGIRIMTRVPGLGVKWVNDRELDLIRVLLCVLKDMQYDLPRDVDHVVNVLLEVIRVGVAESPLGEEGSSARMKLTVLMNMIMAELASSSAIVRTAAQKCVELLAELYHQRPAELFMSNRDRLLSQLYTKPLRALPFQMQIGIIEAVRYCISLQPPLPELNDELLRLLHETLALADADDMALVGRNNARQVSVEIIKLRVACIKLLTASMPLTDFFAKQHQTRQKVTGVYFKSLYSPSPEVKEVAHEGLRMVLTHQTRLPKELLQTGLRPILMNLADPKRLSIPGLEGLARLLELLTNYFKVEIGHKLLDHFRVVADPQMLQASSRLPLVENEGITKLVRLANIFHLLPSAAHIFLENLVNAIVQTEAQMHFSGQSPFSEPLAKYLDRYPAEAVDFFMRHLHFPRHVRTFRSILQAKLATNVLRELASRTSLIVSGCLDGRDPSLVLPGLLVCSDLAELIPDWLTSNPYVVDAVLALWAIEPTAIDPLGASVPDVRQRYSLLISIFMKALQQTPRIDLLFPLVAVFSRSIPWDVVRVTQFLYEHVAFSSDLAFKRNVLTRFVIWFLDQSVPATYKVHFIQYVVTPTLLVYSTRSSSKLGLLDDSLVNKIHVHIWQPMNDDAAFAQDDDAFRVELLHLTTVMVHRYPEYLQDAKKDIIRCAWHYITSEDAIVKQTAYLLAARFFEAFEGPQKFHLRVWTGLLKPPHIEAKALVRQALDIIAPVLLRSQTFDSGYPQWAKTTRRLLAEEGAGWQQVALIYHLIVRQRSLFYPVRALFVPHIVNYVSKLGLGQASHDIRTLYECRSLSVEILQVVFDWEQQATSSAPAASATQDMKGLIPNAEGSWITPLPLRESIVSYLVRLCTIAHDAQTRAGILPRALELMRSIVGPNGWSDVTFKLHFFSRALEQNDFKGDAAMLAQAQSSAKVLQVICAEKDDSWFLANSGILSRLVRKGLLSEDSSLQDSLHVVYEHLIRLFPIPKEDEEQPSEMSDFHTFVYASIGENLRITEESRTNTAPVLRGVLLMVKSIVQTTPERVEPFAVPLMKLLSKLAKDHIQSSQSTPGFEQNVRLIMSILEISQQAVAYLGEQRRWLLSALVACAEKSKSHNLCRAVLEIARQWAMNKRDPYPTMKEKATLLQKMAAFELRGDRAESLFNMYLELIYDIYTEPSLRRTDLTTKLEQSFLLGCRATDLSLRERFIDLMDVSIPRSLFSRLTYIIGVQNWEALADHNWMFLALHLLLGSVDPEYAITADRKGSFEESITSPPLTLEGVSSLVRPMQRLLCLDPQKVHDVWVSVFPTAWACLSRREQTDITHHFIILLSKDYHVKQAELRPNVIQTLLEGVLACSPPMNLPPHLVKYLAKTFGAWHVASELLTSSLDHLREEEVVVRDTVYDSLAEMYAELAEDDVFYGLWRRRALYSETNIAIAYEQCGMWEQASSVYEAAQSKTRAGNLPFSEAEFCLWEDHWMLAAEKLQQWDVLYDLARAENNHELMLESAWRTKDWAEQLGQFEEQIGQLPDVATPRRRVFEAFIILVKAPATSDLRTAEFTKLMEDAMQLTLRKWTNLPPHLSAAHVPLLQHFQQFVELQEAVQIFGSLIQTTLQNLEKRSSDLKMVLQAWRERLPNPYDDISIWSDLVAWRQNVFNSINKTYLPLLTNANTAAGTGGSSAPTFGYRGYHETAWIINRFAHVSRKHDLLDVCFSQLNRIYTLPNIEISEAFLKLREQARCHYQKPGDLQAGLEVINNTNLIYFSTTQKAEFYTLKAMFYAKFGRNDEANAAFGQAIQLDMMQAKGWAAWGRYNDRLFKENPGDMVLAAHAVHCYLQAAGLYKTRKSRPLLARVLWLLSVDDGTLTISRAFDTYKGDAAYWYWITLIPQLCLSLSQRELKQARYLLLNLAKLYPQALFFHLRTTKEDLNLARHQAAKAAAVAAHRAAAQSRADGSHDGTPDANGDVKMNDETSASAHQSPSRSSATADTATSQITRQSPDYVEEVVQILKTAFPLLILSMETMVDNIQSRFRASSEEEIYRLTCVLLGDAVGHFVMRVNADDNGQLHPQTVQTIERFAHSLSGPIRQTWEDDFITGKPNQAELVQRLQRWRDRYERHLDARPRVQSLDMLSHHLLEFQYGKWDEIEVPGQYTEDKDNNQNFVRLLKFGPTFENCRTNGYAWKRFTIYGHDHSKTSFAAQIPSNKHARREERLMHMLRTLNLTLFRKKESRKRNLHFHLPVVVPCSSNMRLVQNDASYITLGDIYDQYCEESGIAREDPILLAVEKLKVTMRDAMLTTSKKLDKTEYISLKKEIADEVSLKMIPPNVISRYMTRTMAGPGELWRMRKQFALQVASTSFVTHVLCIGNRAPQRFNLSLATGMMYMSDLIPSAAANAPILASSEIVPFRLTPNMQHFMGPILLDGLLAVGIMTIGRCLTEPEFDLESHLCLFARDEVVTLRTRAAPQDMAFRPAVIALADGVVKRAEYLGCKAEREAAIAAKDPQNLPTVPVLQTVTSLISDAMHPSRLAKMPEIYMPWF